MESVDVSSELRGREKGGEGEWARAGSILHLI
jgi:hypothetical protein